MRGAADARWMRKEDAKHLLEVLGVADQAPIQARGAEGAHESLRDAVGLRRPKRRAKDLDPSLRTTSSNALVNFLIAVANQEANRLRSPAQDPRQVPRLLGHPERVRIRCTPSEMHAAAPQLNEEQDGESLQPDGVDREEVDREQAVSMHANELTPRQARPSAGGTESGGA
jgi:hypothetical protein